MRVWCAAIVVSLWSLIARADDGLFAVSSVAPRPAGVWASRSPGAREFEYEQELYEAASVYQLPVALLRAVLRVESDGDPRAVSVKGAMGLMQLMPETAKSMGIVRPFDARESILGGARYLRVLANRWAGDLVLTIASYNAGPAAVERYRGVPPFRETRRYVRRVLEHYVAYRQGKRLAKRSGR